jgi:CheY-like chemotaxis protein
MIKQDESTRHIPVLLLVGSFEPFDQDEAERVGADGFMVKPFQSIRELVGKVSELLGPDKEPVLEKAETSDIDNLYESSVSETYKGGAETADIFLGDAGMDDEMIETTRVTGNGSRNAHSFSDITDDDLIDQLGERTEQPEEHVRNLEGFDWSAAPSERVRDEEVPTNGGVVERVRVDDEPSELDDDGELEVDTLRDIELEPGEDTLETIETEEPAFNNEQPEGIALTAFDDAPAETSVEPVMEPVAEIPESKAEAAPSVDEPSDEFITLVARRVVEKLSDRAVREIAKEAVPSIAERLIREALDDDKKT